MIVSFDFVIEMKKALQSKFSTYLHFHDCCGGQYFTLEQSNAEITAFISRYLEEQGLHAVFSEDNLQFTITEKTKG